MNKPKYKQFRKGEFVANVIPRGQCGFRVGQQRFAYEATVIVDDLDENGWCIDNRDLDKAVSEAFSSGHWQASCEDLAGGILTAIFNLIGDRADAITATVWPNEFASLTVTWDRGDDLPQWVPIKVEPTEAPVAPVVATKKRTRKVA